MKRLFTVLVAASALLMVLAPAPAHAQVDDALSVLDPVNIDGYLKPLQLALGQAMGTGTFHGALIPVSGFNASLDIITMQVWFQDKDRTYTASTPEGFDPPTQAEASTIVGDGSATVVTGDGGAEYVFPGGFNMDNFFMAVPQLGLVFIPGTELLVRYITISTGDTELGSVDYLALGARHNVSQYFTNLPVDVSAGAWYHKFDIDSDLMTTKAWQIGAQVSKTFSMATVFGGLGYESYSASVEYDSDTGPETETVKVDMDGESSIRLTGGVNLALSVVHVYGTLDYAKRLSASLALGFGF